MKKFLESKWASRKLWTLIATALFVVITDILNIPIDAETYWGIIAVVVAYITGQSFVDAKQNINEARNNK